MYVTGPTIRYCTSKQRILSALRYATHGPLSSTNRWALHAECVLHKRYSSFRDKIPHLVRTRAIEVVIHHCKAPHTAIILQCSNEIEAFTLSPARVRISQQRLRCTTANMTLVLHHFRLDLEVGYQIEWSNFFPIENKKKLKRKCLFLFHDDFSFQ